MSLKSDFVAYLESQIGVTELVSNRIFPDAAPEVSVKPFIVYYVTDTQNHLTFSGTTKLIKSTIRIESWGMSALSVMDIVEQLRISLDGYRGTWNFGGETQTEVRLISAAGAADSIEWPQNGEDNPTHGAAITLNIWHYSAIAGAASVVYSFNGRTGIVVPEAGDYTAEQVGADAAGSAATVQGNLDDHTGETTTAHGGIVASDDARLSDARTPTLHAESHATGGDDEIEPGDIGAEIAGAALSVQGNLNDHTGETTTAHGGIVADDDSRLSDSRNPLSHASTHSSGQTDEIKAENLGTSSTDTSYVLKPNGSGGVSFGPGGSGDYWARWWA